MPFLTLDSCLLLSQTCSIMNTCRKSRAKKGPLGRPLGSTKGDGSTPKRHKVAEQQSQKVAEQESSLNSSPGPVTRR
jgi:hypothetical protein